MEIKKILFPVDLAGSSYRTVPQVRTIADRFDAELHLLMVLESLEGYNTFPVPHTSLDLMEREEDKHARHQLEEFADKYFLDRPKVELVVLRGDTVEQILKYIDEAGIDMVIVTSHERSGLKRAIFGNTAEEITNRSPVPVTVINPYAERAKGRERRVHQEDLTLS